MTNSVLTPPLIDRLIPVSSALVRVPLQLALGVAFVALLAQLRIDVGPVPITGQTLGVLLIAAAYGFGLGTLTMVSYLIVGGLGLGVFTGGASGWAYLAGTTGGYLVGFVLAAALVGYLAQRGWDRRPASAALAMLFGNLVIYACGLAWLAQYAPDFATTLAWGLIPFIPGDLVKLALAAALLPTAWRLLGQRR
jgi:biotin transport system substrate-specific component